MDDNGAVGRWFGIWLRAWRSEPLAFVSPLSVRAVRARLIEGSTSYWRSAFTFGGFGGVRVVGRVGTRRISLQAVQGGVRNSWRPLLRGRLEPAETGSRFVGRLGWSPFVRAFSALWLGCGCCALLVLVVRAVALSLSGHSTADAFLVCLIPLGFVLFFVALTAWGIRAGRREATYLRSWMADRLQTAEAGVRGYRPWQNGRSG